MSDEFNAIVPKIVPLVRLLSSPIESEAIAALRALLRLLASNDLDIHALVDRIEHGDSEPLSAGEMQALYDQGFEQGFTKGAEHGRHSAILAAQSIGTFAAPVDSEINGYSWQQISQHCLINKHLFHGRDAEFVESVAESLTRFGKPTSKQAKWLKDLFMRKFGGKDYMTTPSELRLALVAHGFVPLPLYGKAPPIRGKNNKHKGFSGWQNLDNVTPALIEMWARTWPDSENTGCLTRLMPALDADILNEDAARAIEVYVRERYEKHGEILVRFGKPPKRAIPFRTDKPFAKIVVNLLAANGNAEKIEFLGDGQQLVVDGIHPDTGQPYRWHGGELWNIARENLPDIREVDARALTEELAELLVRDFGYARVTERPKAKSNGGGGSNAAAAGGGAGATDWQHLCDRIRDGQELHDSLRDLAAKMVRGGMDGGATVNFLRGLLNSSAAPRDARWQDRYDDLPRQVDSIQAKIEREQAAAVAAAAAPASVTPAPGAGTGAPPPPPLPPPPLTSPAAGAAPGAGVGAASSPIEDTLQTFERWLNLPSRTPVYAMLGTVVANLLPGDPVWLGLVAPPSSAKTELLNAVSGLPFVVSVSTLTLASLLSGVPRRQRVQGATGGLLRQVANPGVLCLKDFTSTLTMRPESKAEVLSALREIYDGKWTRHLGTDGGRTLHWEGKLGLVFGCTGAIDTQHSVSDALGNRFLLSRLEPGKEQLRWALRHAGGKAAIMRRELAEAVNLLFTVPQFAPQELSKDETDHFERMTGLVARLRGAVERDRYRRDLDAIYGAEGPGRFGLSLERLLAGLDALGVERKVALDVVFAVALDSTPPLRRAIYWFLCQPLNPLEPPPPGAAVLARRTTKEVAEAMRLPAVTVRRGLEELTSYGLASCFAMGQGVAAEWQGIVLL